MKNLQLLQSMATLFENVEEFVGRFGAKHCDAGLAEVGNAFEHRRGGEVTARVKDAAILVGTAFFRVVFRALHFADSLDIDEQLFL